VRADDELLFRNGTIFDGSRFLPAGTNRPGSAQGKISPGRTAGVGLAGHPPSTLTAGPLPGPGSQTPTCTPVFAGDPAGAGVTCRRPAPHPSMPALVAAYAGDHPDEEWITGGGWAMDAFPARYSRPAKLLDAVVPRPAGVSCPTATVTGAWGQQQGSHPGRDRQV